MRLQFERVYINHDLAIASAEGLRNRGPRHVGNLISNVEAAEVLKLRFVQAQALESDQTNRKTRSVELQDDGRQRAGRQTPEVRHREIRNGAEVRVGIRAGL